MKRKLQRLKWYVIARARKQLQDFIGLSGLQTNASVHAGAIGRIQDELRRRECQQLADKREIDQYLLDAAHGVKKEQRRLINDALLRIGELEGKVAALQNRIG